MGFFDFLNKREIADVYLDMRNQALLLNPDKINLVPENSDSIFGVIMETGYKDYAVTLLCLGDSTVSLYFSNGGGIIGIGQHEGPKKACHSILSFAKEFTSHFKDSEDFPIPKKGNTVFYFLTLNGVLTFEAKESELGNGRSPLSPLFVKAHELISEARIIDEKKRRDHHELMNAATTGNTDKIKSFIQNGANLNAADSTGLTPLMAASYKGQTAVLKQLVQSKVTLDSKDESGYTALMYASNTNNLACVKYLVENGANINESDNDGSTPLMFCAQHGYNDIVMHLLEKGADPNVKGAHGLDAIGFAKQNNHTETQKIIQSKVLTKK